MYGEQFREFICGYWGLKGWGGCHVAVGILLLYLHFSLSLSQFQPIFVVCHHFCCPMSLFQGHVACQNFTLTCRASFVGCVLIYFCNKQFEINKNVDCCLMTCHNPDLSYFLRLWLAQRLWHCAMLWPLHVTGHVCF